LDFAGLRWHCFVNGFLPGGLVIEQPPEVEDAKISLHEMFAPARYQAALRLDDSSILLDNVPGHALQKSHQRKRQRFRFQRLTCRMRIK
jgi:hypothetical protein